jgi:hypothetical protein
MSVGQLALLISRHVVSAVGPIVGALELGLDVGSTVTGAAVGPLVGAVVGLVVGGVVVGARVGAAVVGRGEGAGVGAAVDGKGEGARVSVPMTLKELNAFKVLQSPELTSHPLPLLLSTYKLSSLQTLQSGLLQSADKKKRSSPEESHVAL